MNRAITTALAGIAIAQLLKIPTQFAKTKNLEITTMIGTGGMPSSHSCGVTALASYIGWDKGVNSSEFAIATMLGLIVMYDATGIRRHAGETAVQVNDLDADVEELAGDHPGVYHIKREKKLKESLGHQPAEVAVGALLGIAVGTASYLLSTIQRPTTPWDQIF
jgi:acid phosphatase family membrane protein YuiD